MVMISGYQITSKLYESSNSLVYRGYRETTREFAILKMLKDSYPLPEKVAWFKREYEITKSLQIPGVVNVYSLKNEQNRWVMLIEDFGAESLELMRKQEMTLTEFFSVAIRIVEILGRVHHKQIIHKDINPSNIVLNPTTGELKLIDFGISTVLSQEHPTICNPSKLEGTFPYMSPEQTGRMNRAIDYRTDFYSLGVTFYQLLTGQLPFPTTDVMELLHCHIAKQPLFPHEIRSDIPQIVSEIVIKLMAKNAEYRYQSAYGLKKDLEACLEQWQEKNSINSFILGREDLSNRFQVSQKLYGREAEINQLLAGFERVKQGSKEMMLVSGYSGIGKSALIKEVYKPITQQRSYFVSGKFDQFQRDIPYDCLVQAFRSLIGELLAESDEQLNVWREKILAALGVNAQVMITVIPELEIIIGSQPSVPELEPREAQNRFNAVFQNLVNIFTKPEHPLVLFLDDLQWVDAASLKLIKLLMNAAERAYLFLIGAYRDHEVDNVHPLILTLEEIKQAGGAVHHISLNPLDLFHVQQLVIDTLNVEFKTAQPLAELLFTKTHGNPFFINEFLKSLYSEELLTFNSQKGIWQWNLGNIQERNITDNVVEMMLGKVQKLSKTTQKILQLAACIGNQFNLQTLAIAWETSPSKVAATLWEAIAKDLILPLSKTYNIIELDVYGLPEKVTVEYKFTHDRIQQAVYSLISEVDKQTIHWQIGTILLQTTPPGKQEQKIFDIVNQLNLGKKLINQQIKQHELAQLNLIAGKRAKASAAYEPAYKYLKIGLELLTEDGWQKQYDLTLALYNEAAEAAYLSTDFKQMEELTEVVLHQTKTLLDKVRTYEVRIEAYIAQNQLHLAIDIALEALKFLDITFPEKPNQSDVFQALEEIKINLVELRIEDLINLPNMSDPFKLAASRIMQRILSAVYLCNPELYVLMGCKQIHSFIKYGQAPESAVYYAFYGIILCGIVGDIEAGYQFGQLALRRLSYSCSNQCEARVLFSVHGFLTHWKEHLKEQLKLQEAYQNALENGDLEFAAYSAHQYCVRLYHLGTELTKLEQQMADYSDIIAKLKQATPLNYNNIYQQAVLNLLGRGETTCCLIGEYYNEKEMLPVHLKANDITAIFYLFFNKLMLCYLFQDYSQAVASATEAEKYLDGVISSIFVPLFYFYASLAELARFTDASNSVPEHLLAKVTANQAKMKNWAEHAPMNYLHKFYLVEAEQARVLGEDTKARENYDQAIALAQENEYLNEAALAYELAAKFYLARDQRHVARYYLHDAHYAYQRWGAVAKVKEIETRYPQFLATARADTLQSLTPSTTNSSQTTSGVLDLNSVLKASQTISSEIELGKLLKKLMKIAIENAGAQKGFLILENEGNWALKAEGTVDSDDIPILQSISINFIDANRQLPLLSAAIINYVIRTQENVVLNDATHEGQFTRDPYIVATQPKSILCTPLLNQGKLNGIVYLENNLTTGAFTPERLEVLKILSSQAAISIENSRLYEQLEDYNRTLEQKVEVRTQELQEKNQELGTTLQKLKATQAQIIAQEKLASLGALTAGIAHEIKNPLNFVNNFAELSIELTQELLEEIAAQKDRLDLETIQYIEDILNDLSQNAKKINEHGKRADNIVRGMLMHARGQTGLRQLTDINTLLAESVNLAYHGMRGKDSSFNITIKTDYDHNLNQLNVVPQDISRVVLNIVNNACYATHEKKKQIGEEFLPTLSVSTKDLGKQVEIRFRDNGIGIPQELLDKIFNPFFTTKPTGQGTGLGLSISHDIIIQEHQGQIKVETEAGSYTEFIITLPDVADNNIISK